MKIMLSASPSLLFSHKVHNIRFEKQINMYSIQTVIELGLPVSEFSTRISKTLLILNTNFVKQKSKIGYPEVSNREPHDLEPAVITATLWSTYSMMGSLKLLYTYLQSLRIILEIFHLH